MPFDGDAYVALKQRKFGAADGLRSLGKSVVLFFKISSFTWSSLRYEQGLRWFICSLAYVDRWSRH